MAQTMPSLDESYIVGSSYLSLAQRFLTSAHDSVSSLIGETYPTLRAKRKGDRGRLTHAEHDLFRAAAVFAGAGVDAVLKETVRSAVPTLIKVEGQARAKYVDFATSYLQDGQGVNARKMAHLFLTDRPETALREAYIRHLTGSSMQSVEQVRIALSALGVREERGGLFRQAQELKPLFIARNQIAHEMDMTPAALRQRNGRTRHERALTAYVDMCHLGLNYCQKVLNELEPRMNLILIQL